MDINLSRLFYLAIEVQPHPPKRELVKYVPQSELIFSASKKGLTGTSIDLDIPQEQLQHLYDEGSQQGRGSLEEFKMIVSRAILSEVEIRRDEITLSTYLSVIRDISDYLNQNGVQIIRTEESDLGRLSDGDDEIPNIPKFDIGCSPFDLLIQGFYQGITTIIGRPGHGKTSIMITLMEAARSTGSASSLWYYEQEIPMSLMLYRIGPSATRTKFIKGKDRLICGQKSILEIEDEVLNSPDPNRILFIDSPDVMAAGTGDEKRFAIEDIYLGLIRLKPHCKSIFVTSWPRRKDREITLESGAEAWAKAWYSDIILGMAKLGRAPGGFNQVKLTSAKNRFGPSDNHLTFLYDYSTLIWDATQTEVGGDDDW